MNETMQKKLDAAIAYLRARGKYIADPGCKFVPTKKEHTNIRKTMDEYKKAGLVWYGV